MVQPPITEFRALRADEVDASYALYQQVRDWLRIKEIRLWLAPLPKEKFVARQTRGELFGLFVGEKLAVILALVHEMPSYWQVEIGPGAQWWLSTLAASPEFRGRQFGRYAIARAAGHLRARKVDMMYLDCVAGFFPKYYEEGGFRTVTA